MLRKSIELFDKTDGHLYQWTAITRLGQLMRGQIRAPNKYSAKRRLHEQELIVKKIKSSYDWPKRLTQHNITMAMGQLTRLLSADLTLLQALHILISCQTHSKMVALWTQIQLDVTTGIHLSEALQRHPQWFDSLVCALIELGEQSGNLVNMMEQVFAHYTAKTKMKKHLQAILTYPLSVLGIAGVVTVYLLLAIVPQFQSLFQSCHARLPFITRAMIVIAETVKSYGFYYLVLSWSSIILLKYGYKKYSSITLWCDTLLLKLPCIGLLCQHIYLARSFHALAITHQAGLPMVDALQWIARVAGNLQFSHAFLSIRKALTQGDNMRTAVYSTQLFPELVVQMLNLGEESGTLETLLFDIAHYYNRSLEHTVQRFSQLIEPTIMVLLGVLIGSLVLAMYLPIISLGTLI